MSRIPFDNIMKLKITIAVALGTACLSTVAFTAVALKAPTKLAKHVMARTPILVELFTSEGCSSCPSADHLLKRLQAEQPVDGALIIPLSEHVDYWNNSSWKDRFSSASFSARQSGYVHALHSNGAYTPQMVVDGQSEFVGSEEETALNSISAAAQKRKAQVQIKEASASTNSVTVDVSVDRLPWTKAGDTNELYVAVTENNLETHVGGGENGGRRLLHTAVVRDLERVGAVSPAPYQGHITIKLDSHWKRSDLALVAFVQGHQSGRILGVSMTNLSAH